MTHREFTRRYHRPGYEARRRYSNQRFTQAELVAILRDIYRGWCIRVIPNSGGPGGAVTFIAQRPWSPIGIARALWALCWHVPPRESALDLLWRNNTLKIYFSPNRHEFMLGAPTPHDPWRLA